MRKCPAGGGDPNQQSSIHAAPQQEVSMCGFSHMDSAPVVRILTHALRQSAAIPHF
ncbi:hypothetical protein [Azospirillum argentinense]